MPPVLILILCAVFVLFLLRTEHRQFPERSLAFWVPTIWLLLSCSKPMGVWFGMSGANLEEGSYLDRIALSILLVTALLILIQKRFDVLNVLKQNIIVLLFIVYTLISIFWSDLAYVSFKRWIREVSIPFVMAMVISSTQSPLESLESIMRRTIYVLLPFSIVLIKYYPHLGVLYSNSGSIMWQGTMLHKNGLSTLCFFTIFFLFWNFMRRWQKRVPFVAGYQIYVDVGLLLLATYLFLGPHHIFTNSATSFVALFAGLTGLIGLLRLKKPNIVLGSIIILIVIVMGTITPFLGGFFVSDMSAVLNRNETLTGRSDIWAYLIPYFSQHPIIGHGFGGFYTDIVRMNLGTSSGHNGYLDTLINVGVVGYILLFLFLLISAVRAQKFLAQDFHWGCLWFCFVLMTALHNITESSTTSFLGLLPTLLLFLSTTGMSKSPQHVSVLPEDRQSFLEG